MSTNTPERFREVEPLPIADGCKAATIRNGRTLIVHMLLWDIAEARALRDWLNKALPEEKP